MRTMPNNQSVPVRILSLDQFRGYTILGMILVNFIGYFDCIPPVFKHNDNYFSYADSIMPAFHLAVGFSFRLTMLHRLAMASMSLWGIWWTYFKRSLILVFIGVLFYGIGGDFKTWDQFSKIPAATGPTAEAEGSAQAMVDGSEASFSQTFLAQWRHWVAETLKSRMWNTLAIIGVTQIVILPFVATSFLSRVLAMMGFGLGHMLLTYWFNWGFVLGEPENWMVEWWGTGTNSSWDGGFFGPLSWAVVMLSGTLAHDIVMDSSRKSAIATLLLVGSALMALAWGLSSLSILFDAKNGAVESKHRPGYAESPFFPALTGLSKEAAIEFRVEPPFVQPPVTASSTARLKNYWMMIKRIPTLSFTLCAVGFAFLVYGIFVGACDVWGWRFGILNTFGTNALIAYLLHNTFVDQISRLVPRDAPLWYVMLGFAAFFFTTWSFVRYFEKRHIFIRL